MRLGEFGAGTGMEGVHCNFKICHVIECSTVPKYDSVVHFWRMQPQNTKPWSLYVEVSIQDQQTKQTSNTKMKLIHEMHGSDVGTVLIIS